ncbi:MAG: hypothetical protein WD058_04325 [Dehalococcoidia bacterium]
MLRRLILVPALLLATLALVACESPDGAPPTIDATSAAPEGTPTATESATATAATPAATRTPSTGGGEGAYGAWFVEAATGEVTELYEGDDAWAIRDRHQPHLGGLGTGVWLSTNLTQSHRYGPDGEVETTVDGWSVVESADGESLTYFEGATSPFRLVAERGDDRHEFQSPGGFAMRAFSADGLSLAWIEWGEDDDSGALTVLDMRDGDTQVLADNISRLQGDREQFIVWSPSGEYLAYERVGFGDRDADRLGAYIVEVETGEETRIPDATLAANSWARTPEGERLVTLTSSQELLLTFATGGQVSLATFPENARLEVHGDSIIVSLVGQRRSELSVGAFDAVTGRQLVEYTGEADVVQIPAGVASAVITRSEIACTGLVIDHPDLREERPCDVRHVRWSPDARYLAMVSSARGRILVLDTRTGEEREIEVPDGISPALTWTIDGRHILLVRGGGP